MSDLEAYLRERELLGGPVTERRRIGDGRSTITELVSDGERRVVLRRPGPTSVQPGGCDVLREARILCALQATPVPVPRVLAVDGGDVLAQPFFVMEHLAGIVATSQTPPGLGGDALTDALVEALATLHALDPAAVGLGDLGASCSDMGRHLRGFAGIIDPDDEGLDGELGELLERLLDDPPPPRAATIIHGDYRLGNVMLALDEPERLLAILDWELSEIGDPLRDVGYFLATYAMHEEALHALTELSTATLEAGWPSRSELAERYAAATGTSLADIGWYIAMALWKLAVLFEHQRRDGAPPGLVERFLAAARPIMTAAA